MRCADAVPVAGAELEPPTVKSVSSCSAVVPFSATFGAASFIGGGRFFPPPLAPGTGASLVGAGSGGGGWGLLTSSWRALKLRFLRMGAAAGAGADEAIAGVVVKVKRRATR